MRKRPLYLTGTWSDQCHQIGGQKPDSPGLTPSGEIKENKFTFMNFTNESNSKTIVKMLKLEQY